MAAVTGAPPSLEDLFLGKKAVFYGPARTGKTSCIRSILASLGKETDRFLIYSSRDDVHREYQNFIHKADIHGPVTIPDPANSENIITGAEALQLHLENVWGEQEKLTKSGNPRRLVIVLEDWHLDFKKLEKTPIMRQLFFQGRNRNISLIATFQDAMDPGPPFRKAADISIFTTEFTRESFFSAPANHFSEEFQNKARDQVQHIFSQERHMFALVRDASTEGQILDLDHPRQPKQKA